MVIAQREIHDNQSQARALETRIVQLESDSVRVEELRAAAARAPELTEQLSHKDNALRDARLQYEKLLRVVKSLERERDNLQQSLDVIRTVLNDRDQRQRNGAEDVLSDASTTSTLRPETDRERLERVRAVANAAHHPSSSSLHPSGMGGFSGSGAGACARAQPVPQAYTGGLRDHADRASCAALLDEADYTVEFSDIDVEDVDTPLDTGPRRRMKRSSTRHAAFLDPSPEETHGTETVRRNSSLYL